MVKFIERDRSRFLVDNIPINIGDLVNLGSELVQVRRHDTMIKEEALRQLQARESAKPSAQNMAEIYGADLVMVSDFPADCRP